MYLYQIDIAVILFTFLKKLFVFIEVLIYIYFMFVHSIINI